MKIRDVYSLILPIILLLCFVLVFALAFTPEKNTLSQFAIGITWFATFASLMTFLDRIYREDKEQGSLDMLCCGSTTTLMAIFARILAHWCIVALPLCIVATLGGVLFGLASQYILLVVISLASGTLTLVSIGAIVAALCASTARSTILTSVLLFPLLVPVIVFGIQAANQQLDKGWQLCLVLVGSGCIQLAISPMLSRAALHASID